MTEKDAATENARKLLEEDKKARAVSDAQYAERMKGKPTPTQEENDIVALGGHVFPEHEADGSNPDPHGQAASSSSTHSGGHATKHMEAGRAAPYQTRESRAKE